MEQINKCIKIFLISFICSITLVLLPNITLADKYSDMNIYPQSN
jgi:hypothetical protein